MTASITLHVYFNPLFKNQSLEKGENNRRELSKILSCKSAKIPYKSRVFGVWLSNNEYKFQEVYQRIPFQLSSEQFRLKQFRKILILQGFSGLFGTDMN